MPDVLILMGSDSDAPVMQPAADALSEFGISSEMTVASAHRSPARLGWAVAPHTTRPVIGVPIDSSALKGLDALLATVQMPPGVPVATMAIGKPGATNAAVLAAQILGVADRAMAKRLEDYKTKLADKVEAAAAKLIQ